MNIKQKINMIRRTKDIQEQNLCDEYMVGLYNGLECALSIIENREANYKYVTKEPEVIETNEEAERTITSGIRRRNIKNERCSTENMLESEAGGNVM